MANLALWYIPICIVAFGSALALVSGYTLTRGEHEENAANPDTKVWKAINALKALNSPVGNIGLLIEDHNLI